MTNTPLQVRVVGQRGREDAARYAEAGAPRTRGRFSPDDIRHAMKLYAVTDRTWLDGRSLADCVAQVIAGGATFVQLREKDAPREEIIALAEEIAPLCQRAGVPFVIDDDVDAALAVGADGVHVGQDDTACTDARRILGPDAIIGVSAQTVEQALKAQADGADYLGVGAVIATDTKPDAAKVSRDELRAIVAAVDIPVVIIGGLNAQTVDSFADTGVDGIAVVSALFAAQDCGAAARELTEKSAHLIATKGNGR